MERLVRKVLSILLAVLLLVNTLPQMTVRAEDGEITGDEPVTETTETDDQEGDGDDPGGTYVVEPEGDDADPTETDEPGTEDLGLSDEPEYLPGVYTGNDGNVDVTVTDETGVLPYGTVMTVTRVSSSEVKELVSDEFEGNITNVIAVDITFTYKGEEVEPNGPINVQISGYNRKADEAVEQKLVHIDDENNVEVIAADISNEKSVTTADFTAESFSIYAVVTTGEDARLTVN